MNFKRIFKIIAGIVIFLTLPSLLFFGFVYFKYNEDLPTGTQGPEADALANKMLTALNHDAYKNTNYLEWTFKGIHQYKWQKDNNQCEVKWKGVTVNLDLNNTQNSEAFLGDTKLTGQQAQDYIKTATDYFNNDSFWLVAPYKVFDAGTERRLVNYNGNDALLITYTSGGSTPGDSYLWILDQNGKPISYKMWVSIIPIGGLEATWNNWKTTESGAQLPTTHKLAIMELDMGDVIGR